MKIIGLDAIKKLIDADTLMADIESAVVRLSAGEVDVPPVGLLKTSKGIIHIKFGYMQNDSVFVIKIASSYHENNELGLPSGSGLMVVMDAHTGETLAVLDDKGWLTDVQTSIAGAIAVKYLVLSR